MKIDLKKLVDLIQILNFNPDEEGIARALVKFLYDNCDLKSILLEIDAIEKEKNDERINILETGLCSAAAIIEETAILKSDTIIIASLCKIIKPFDAECPHRRLLLNILVDKIKCLDEDWRKNFEGKSFSRWMKEEEFEDIVDEAIKITRKTNEKV